MLVFIDESGDPGFKTADGASPNFVAAMVIFRSPEAAISTQYIIENSAARKIHKPEFKFSKCRHDVRDEFFKAAKKCDFSVRSIVVQKDKIYSPRLTSDKERFYEFFVRQMMKHDNGTLHDAKVIIDGSGDRAFRQDLNLALRRRLNEGTIKDVRFKDSKSDVLVQLADMCAGAIARSYRKDRPDPWRWRTMLQPRIDDIWDFK